MKHIMASSHIKRWITALIAVPALFALIFYGSVPVFCALIVAAILLGVHEYNEMAFGEGHLWEKTEGLIIALLIALSFYLGDLQLVMAVIIFSFFTAFFTYTARITCPTFDILPVAKVVFGFLYIPATMSHFILIRNTPQGVLWIFFILFLAFSGDVAAYYVGRTWGRRKLLPLVSPGKTVEGTIGLFAGSIIGCVVFQQLFFPALPVVHAAFIGFFGSVIGQLGDLCESAIKRASGFKDSGSLLPGHGGILDRLDCLIFIAPFVYYYQIFIIK
jgi:phosphatidate cytidylyltransferase